MELTAVHKEQDPFIEFGFKVAGSLFYDMLSKSEVVAADRLSGVFGKTAYYDEVIRANVVHVMPRNKVQLLHYSHRIFVLNHNQYRR